MFLLWCKIVTNRQVIVPNDCRVRDCEFNESQVYTEHGCPAAAGEFYHSPVVAVQLTGSRVVDL